MFHSFNILFCCASLVPCGCGDWNWPSATTMMKPLLSTLIIGETVANKFAETGAFVSRVIEWVINESPIQSAILAAAPHVALNGLKRIKPEDGITVEINVIKEDNGDYYSASLNLPSWHYKRTMYIHTGLFR
ncbi:uncharacterized protein EURHEDRAFT_175159 [Aspergillus ruber CBS 135680]|uniref:Uncharacterized protein n=1 Tax=Aspergillus ruber (strain CBS 135680) TaxID=1388766 RepID=A0A017S927_ASPRC|nr:uncharacterized protein EURHEDRAFT_175159 [Aspergillus ruber CBS 135680]EYE92680.1 hypothetical protein EURHEDRAFT_175159 [Aspergillus ruber CBS 135680]